MLSFEEYQEIGRKEREEKKRIEEKMARIRNEELIKMGVDINANQFTKPKYDHPSMPEDGFITTLYIIGMIASLIFKEWYIAWIVLTILYAKFISRHDND